MQVQASTAVRTVNIPNTGRHRKILLLIIIMEICKAPTLRLKALNKHIHIMYIEMENVIIYIYIYISASVQA